MAWNEWCKNPRLVHTFFNQCLYKPLQPKWHHFLLRRVPADRMRAAWRIFIYVSSGSWLRERQRVWWWRMEGVDVMVELSKGLISASSLPPSISASPDSKDLCLSSLIWMSFNLARLLLREVFSCWRTLILNRFAFSCCSISHITSPVAVKDRESWVHSRCYIVHVCIDILLCGAACGWGFSSGKATSILSLWVACSSISVRLDTWFSSSVICSCCFSFSIHSELHLDCRENQF